MLDAATLFGVRSDPAVAVGIQAAKQARVTTICKLFRITPSSIMHLLLPTDGNFSKVAPDQAERVDLGLFYVASFLEIVSGYLMVRPPFSVYQIGFTYAAPAKHIGRNRLGGGGAVAASDVPLAGDPQAKVVLHRIFDDGIDILSDGGGARAGRHSGRRSGRRRQTLPHRSLEEKARMINLNMVSIFRDDGMNIRLLQPVPGCFFQTLPNLAICVDPSPEANPALGSAAPRADSPSLQSILEEPLGDGFVVLGDSVACMDRPDDTTVLPGARADARAGATAM